MDFAAQHLTVEEGKIASLRREGHTPAEIAKMMGVSRDKATAQIKSVAKIAKAFEVYYGTAKSPKDEQDRLRKAGVKLRQLRRVHELLLQRLDDGAIAEEVKLPVERVTAVREQIDGTKTATGRLLKDLAK